MISVEQAASTILDLVRSPDSQLDIEVIPLAESLGRIVAIDISSNLDFPHWANSAMDGYALRFADLERYDELTVIAQDIPAGTPANQALQAGECVRIFTGGMLPPGADTVVMQEDTERHGDRLRLTGQPRYGDYVRQQGEFYRAGTVLLTAGTKLTPTHLGALAALGQGTVTVYRQPAIAIFSTGDELQSLEAGTNLLPGQIFDSNQYLLASLVTQAGGRPISLGIVRDRPTDVEAAIQQAIANADIVISSGGVSVGDYDFVETILNELKAEIHIRSVAIKPGKPLTVATLPSPHHSQRQVIYFGVPGNPVSAAVTFWRFIAGAISKHSGLPETAWQPTFISALTTTDLNSQGRRETYLWGQLSWQNQAWYFQPVSNYSSGNVINIAETNALAVLQVHQTYVPASDTVTVMMLPSI